MPTQVLVEQCAPTVHPISGSCSGPPGSFPQRHEAEADRQGHTAADHVEACTGCLATMVQCWRGRCERAGHTVAEYLQRIVDKATRTLSIRLRPVEREEARQDVLLRIVRKARTVDSWSPDSLAELDNHRSWIRHAINMEYNTWYETNVTNYPVQLVWDTDTDDPADNPDGGVDEGHEKRADAPLHGDAAYAGDPADLVVHHWGNALVSPAERGRIETTLDVLRHQLASMADDRIAFYAGWMNYLAATGGHGSIADYSRQNGVNRVTGWRHLDHVEAKLVELIDNDRGLDSEVRAHALNFLHHLSSLAGPTPPAPDTTNDPEEPEQ